MSITTISERELALTKELADARYAGLLIAKRCEMLVAERDALASQVVQINARLDRVSVQARQTLAENDALRAAVGVRP